MPEATSRGELREEHLAHWTFTRIKGYWQLEGIVFVDEVVFIGFIDHGGCVLADPSRHANLARFFFFA